MPGLLIEQVLHLSDKLIVLHIGSELNVRSKKSYAPAADTKWEAVVRLKE